MFMGFDGWHALIILGMVLVPLAIVAAIVLVVVLVVVRVSRTSAPPAAPVSPSPPQSAPTPAPSASDRLAELERLREAGRISDAEYEQTRARILGQL